VRLARRLVGRYDPASRQASARLRDWPRFPNWRSASRSHRRRCCGPIKWLIH